MKILLVTPPLTQLNTPYPATCHLQGFLRSRGIDAGQMDLSIALIEKLFTQEQLQRIFQLDFSTKKLSKHSRNLLQQSGFYIQTIEPVMRFLSGRDSSLAQRFSDLDFWPQSKRFPSEDDLEWAFGVIGNHDRATHLCTLFLKDLCDFINQTIDPNFELIRYAESLCLRLPEFAPLQQTLLQPPSFIDQLMLDIFAQKVRTCNPEMVGFCVPFSGKSVCRLALCTVAAEGVPVGKHCDGRWLRQYRIAQYYRSGYL